MATYRKERLEESIKRIIGDALLTEIKDPRIGFATVVKASLSKDFSFADVWVSILGTEGEKRKSMAGLESACSYVQYLVGKEMKLRNTPRIRFHMDTSIEEGVHMVDMIEGLDKGGEAPREPDNGCEE